MSGIQVKPRPGRNIELEIKKFIRLQRKERVLDTYRALAGFQTKRERRREKQRRAAELREKE